MISKSRNWKTDVSSEVKPEADSPFSASERCWRSCPAWRQGQRALWRCRERPHRSWEPHSSRSAGARWPCTLRMSTNTHTDTHAGTLRSLSADQKQTWVVVAPRGGRPLHWSPCRSRPHSSEPQWSQKVRTLKLWMLNLCGTLTLKRWEPTGCRDTTQHNRGTTTLTSVFRVLAALCRNHTTTTVTTTIILLLLYRTNTTTWWPWGSLSIFILLQCWYIFALLTGLFL